MERTDVLPSPAGLADTPAPDVSVIVPLLNEEGSVDELYRRVATALDASGFEVTPATSVSSVAWTMISSSG